MQFGSSLAAGTSTPRGPAATICASSCGVSQSGLGSSRVDAVESEDPLSAWAAAPARPASRNAATTANAAIDLRIKESPLVEYAEDPRDANHVGIPRASKLYASASRLEKRTSSG